MMNLPDPGDMKSLTDPGDTKSLPDPGYINPDDTTCTMKTISWGRHGNPVTKSQSQKENITNGPLFVYSSNRRCIGRSFPM